MRLLLFVAVVSLAGLSGYLVLTGASFLPSPATDLVHRTEVVVKEPGTDSVERDVRSVSTENPIQTQLQVQRYAVGGGTPRELLRSLQSAGPRVGGDVFFGLTLAEMDLRYSRVERGGGCELRDVHVSLDLTITLPEWDVPSDANPALVREWRQFERALTAHEDEHRRIAEEGADALYRAVQGLRRASCAEVNADGRRRVDQLRIQVEAAHRRFDDETGHGRTQGAVWPVP